MKDIKRWLLGAGVRAGKTAAQTAIGVIGAAAAMGQVDWALVGSGALLAALVVSFLMTPVVKSFAYKVGAIPTGVAATRGGGGGASLPTMVAAGDIGERDDGKDL